MYNQQERSLVREKFWISFGKYMSPVPSAYSEKINWINYKTGVRSVNFKMEVNDPEAYIAIELSHKKSEDRHAAFEQFMVFKSILENLLKEEWSWQENTVNEHGKSLARIYKSFPAVSILREEDWPAIISFFKQRIMMLDKFWTEYREVFEMGN